MEMEKLWARKMGPNSSQKEFRRSLEKKAGNVPLIVSKAVGTQGDERALVFVGEAVKEFIHSRIING